MPAGVRDRLSRADHVYVRVGVFRVGCRVGSGTVGASGMRNSAVRCWLSLQ